MPICLAGMHRSGTSMVARLLNACGIYFGPESELLTSEAGEQFWENVHFVRLNEEILARLGGGWDLPPDLAAGWELRPEIGPLRARAAELVSRFRDREPWGWKDPRNSLTLPFWKRVVPELRVVVCVRNPLEVAHSLYRRGYSSPAFSTNLWLTYYRRLLAAVRPEDRVITHYDAFFGDAAAELRRVLRLLELDVAEDAIVRACAAASAGLRHSRATTDDLLAAQALPELLHCYADLCAEAGPVSERALRREPGDDARRARVAPGGAAATGTVRAPEESAEGPRPDPAGAGARSDRGARGSAAGRGGGRVLRRPGRWQRAWLLARRAAAIWSSDGSAALLRKVLRRLRTRVGELTYVEWIAESEPGEVELVPQRQLARALAYRPLISVVTPVYDPPPAVLRATIEAVLAQTYDRWQLCLADGASKQPAVRRVLEECARKDSRIEVRYLEANLGISGNSNEALGLAEGEFVALLDHDDLLAPWALFEVAKRLNEDPDLDFLYSDRDMVREDGRERFQPLFKPGWSPATLLSANYVTHLCVIRRTVVEEIGGFVPETDGAQDWDLFLRVAERTHRIAHIPKVLYHWRVSRASAAGGIGAKPYAPAAQVLAVQRHLDRTGVAARASLDASGTIRLRWLGTEGPRVSIVILGDRPVQVLRACIESILRTTAHRDFEVLVVETGERDPTAAGEWDALGRDPRVRLVPYRGDPNDSAVRNVGVRASGGEAVLFLEGDVEVVEPDWLAELLGWSQQKEVGVVGGTVLDPGGAIERGGIIVGLGGLADDLFAGAEADYFGEFGGARWYRDHLAVSAACMMVRRDVLDAVGGFGEAFLGFGAEVELCLRMRRRGYRVVHTPYARLRRLAPAVWRYGIAAEECRRAFQEHEALLRDGDPYYNANLSLGATIPRLRGKGERASVEFARRLLPPRVGWYSRDASVLAESCDFSASDLEASRKLAASYPGRLEIRSINWFIPSFDHAYYGGIHTILRFAAYFREAREIESRFVAVGHVWPEKIGGAVRRAFPRLSDAPVLAVRSERELEAVLPADASVATLWTTAFSVLKFRGTKRKFYFVQDFEPLFYPAGSTSAQAAATYRFGFYGIANTPTLKEIYERESGTRAEFFVPAVDTEIFHAASGRRVDAPEGPFVVFFYGRPDHPRNGFELGAAALRRLKERLGDKVRIVGAGAAWAPRDFGLQGVIENLGLLEYRQTAELYRYCDVGLVMMFTRHPSYIPLELMASGCLVVSNHNAATAWLLEHGVNCLLSEPSAACLADTLERGLRDRELRAKVVAEAAALIRARCASWEREMEKVYAFMCEPE